MDKKSNRASNERAIKEYCLSKLSKRTKDLIRGATWELMEGPSDMKAQGFSGWKGYEWALKEIEREFEAKIDPPLWLDTQSDDVLTSEPEGYKDEETGDWIEPEWSDYVQYEKSDILRIVFGSLYTDGGMRFASKEDDLRKKTIRLAAAKPELRPVLLPLLKKTASETETPSENSESERESKTASTKTANYYGLSDAADALVLWIDNDGDTYRLSQIGVEKNLLLKMAKGIYNHALAVKLWMYVVEMGAKRLYQSNNGYLDDVFYPKWNLMFPPKTRLETAKHLADSFLEKVQGEEITPESAGLKSTLVIPESVMRMKVASNPFSK